MKRSEILEKYSEAICNAMVEAYASVIGCSGRIQYQIYVWEDGEIGRLEGPQGDTCYLKPYDWEPRELFYVCKISEPFINLWEVAGAVPPDDDEEREKEEEEIIDWLVDEYKMNVSDVLSSIIEEAEREEKWDESEGV